MTAGSLLSCLKGEGEDEGFFFRQPARTKVEPLTFIFSPFPKGRGAKSPIVTKHHSFTSSIARLSSAN